MFFEQLDQPTLPKIRPQIDKKKFLRSLYWSHILQNQGVMHRREIYQDDSPKLRKRLLVQLELGLRSLCLDQSPFIIKLQCEASSPSVPRLTFHEAQPSLFFLSYGRCFLSGLTELQGEQRYLEFTEVALTRVESSKDAGITPRGAFLCRCSSPGMVTSGARPPEASSSSSRRQKQLQCCLLLNGSSKSLWMIREDKKRASWQPLSVQRIWA